MAMIDVAFCTAVVRGMQEREQSARLCAHGSSKVVLLAVLLEQPVERLLLAHGELARLDARVVHAQERVDVVHRLRAHVRELLDLRGDVLDLLVGELQAELLDAALDRVPAREPVPDRDVAREAEVLGLEDLIGRRVIENGLGVNTSLVRESTVTAIMKSRV